MPLAPAQQLKHQAWAERGDRLVAAMLWLVAGVFALLVDGYAIDPLLPIQIICWLSLAFGGWAFLLHGGPQITAAGLFCAASAVFVGYAGLWWAGRLGVDVPPALLQATTAGYFVTVVMYYAFWYDTRTPAVPAKRDNVTAASSIIFGFLLTVLSLVIIVTVPAAYRLAEAASFVGTLILAFGVTGSDQFRLMSVRAMTVIGLIAAFVVVGFDGFGRLPVIGLCAGVAIIFSIRQRTRLLKVCAAVLTPLAAAVLTSLRIERLGGGTSEVDSDVGGIWSFARLIGYGDRLEFAEGQTFFATAVIWFPRDWWDAKPFGLETQIVWLLEPHLSNTGHSMVATVFGEWYYNFGWWGVAVMALPVGLAVRWLDVRRKRMIASRLDSRETVLWAVLLVAAVATMTDLVWSSTFTFAARMLLRAIVIGVLLVLVWLSAAHPNGHRAPDGRRALPTGSAHNQAHELDRPGSLPGNRRRFT